MKTYFFSGIGHATARFAISNNEIGNALDNYHLSGFSNEKILAGNSYGLYKKEHPESTPFDFFASEKMGFIKRHHVTPFPPTQKKMYFAETSLDLAVSAVRNALSDSGVRPCQIGAWFLSTVSPHEQAPGMAATLKAYMVDFENSSPAFTLTSGCSGFNINIERACEYLNEHEDVEHVVVVHAETMSAFLANRIKFIPFVTFGDGAAAVVLSRNQSDARQGIVSVVNYHDPALLDVVGVDKKWNLYMDDSMVKDRAVADIPEAAAEALKLAGWKTEDIDLFVPHQTGNAILLPVAQQLGIPAEKLFLGSQHEYGNTSGATVPIALSMLKQSGKLKPGFKILSAMAGVGGNYGAFTYVVPDAPITVKHDKGKEFEGKKILLIDTKNELSQEITEILKNQGATVYCIEETQKDIADSISKGDVTANYVLYPAFYSMRSYNEILSAIDIIKVCVKMKCASIVVCGSMCENTGHPLFPEFVSSLRALHGILASASGEFLSSGTRLVYYMTGCTDGDFSSQGDSNTRFRIMMKAGQEKLITKTELADRLVRSLIIPKIDRTWNFYENAMVVRCDGFKPEVDI